MPDFKGKLKEKVTFKDKLTIFLKNLNILGFFCKILRQFLVADTRLYTLPCRSVGLSLRPKYFWVASGFWHYCFRDRIAMYPALFEDLTLLVVPKGDIWSLRHSLIIIWLKFYHILTMWGRKSNDWPGNEIKNHGEINKNPPNFIHPWTFF